MTARRPEGRRPDAGRPDARRPPAEGLLGGEQVEGRQAVRELLAAGRRRVHEVVLAERVEAAPILEEIAFLAGRAGVPLRRVHPDAFTGLARSDVPQGIVARADPVVATALAELVGPDAFLVLLDGITDPHNLGAILRSACAAGATGVVLPRRRSAHLGPAAVKAAAGAVEHLAFALVPGASAALQVLRRSAVWSVGLDEDGSEDLEAVAVLRQPLVLVLGAEGRGLSPLTASRCDVLARIPMVGPLPSLNVAAAAAIACFTVLRHRGA